MTRSQSVLGWLIGILSATILFAISSAQSAEAQSVTAPSSAALSVKLPEYITTEEVQRVCRELGIRDWTSLTEPAVLAEEAEIIRRAVGGEATQITAEEFRRGLEVELEHGLRFPDANVTHNHPLLTGRIVLAHLKETMDYYARLEVAELEGDLLKALSKGDFPKAAHKYRQLVQARAALRDRKSVV